MTAKITIEEMNNTADPIAQAEVLVRTQLVQLAKDKATLVKAKKELYSLFAFSQLTDVEARLDHEYEKVQSRARIHLDVPSIEKEVSE